MAIGIDDLDDDVRDDEELYSSNQQPQYYENNTNDDFVSDVLKTKGINDPSRIRFEEDDGSITERSWDSLSKEEKINILNTQTTAPQYSDSDFLDQEELNLINQIRNSGMSPSQFINSTVQQNQAPQQPTYRIEELSDDEIFLLDLESRVGELTDEEAIEALNSAKQNEQLYQKQINGIREEYKEREDYEKEQKNVIMQEEQRRAFENYQAQVVGAIDQFTSVGNLDLDFEDSDKEELAEFMLTQDQNGQNYFYQALQDPVNLVKAAWFILNGDEAFNNVSDYFINQIKLVSQNQYNKGLEDGKKEISSRPSVVIDNKQRNSYHQFNSIDQLDDDED